VSSACEGWRRQRGGHGLAPKRNPRAGVARGFCKARPSSSAAPPFSPHASKPEPSIFPLSYLFDFSRTADTTRESTCLLGYRLANSKYGCGRAMGQGATEELVHAPRRPDAGRHFPGARLTGGGDVLELARAPPSTARLRPAWACCWPICHASLGLSLLERTHRRFAGRFWIADPLAAFLLVRPTSPSPPHPYYCRTSPQS
jgi:hypothetical protein